MKWEEIAVEMHLDIRWIYRIHKKALENKRHKNPHLQNAYNLFGKNEFYYLIIDYCLDTLEKEQYWITSTFCYDRKIGFNNTKKANAPLGYKHTSESRKIMSDIKKQQYKEGKIASNFKFRTVTKHSEETKEKIRQTKLGEKNPMYGKLPHNAKSIEINGVVYPSMSAARQKTGLSRRTIENLVKSEVDNNG